MYNKRLKKILLSVAVALSVAVGPLGNAGAVFGDELEPVTAVEDTEVSGNETVGNEASESKTPEIGENTDGLSENEAESEIIPVSGDDAGENPVLEEIPDTVSENEAAGGMNRIEGDVSDRLYQEGGHPVFAEGAGSTIQSRSYYEDASDTLVKAVSGWDGSSYITVDILGLGVPADDIPELISDVINDHAEFFYVDGTYICETDPSGFASSIQIKAKDGCTIAESDAFNRKVSKIVGMVEKDWTDLQKTMFIHDYLVTHCQYDLTYKKYTAEDAIVRGSAVCEGYSLAFRHLMNKVGSQFKCDYVGSNGINHAWNYLTVNGKQYYIDCTWDDPVTGGTDGHFHEYNCRHEYFLLSRDSMHKTHKSTDWCNKSGDNIYDKVSGSSDLENEPWIEMDSPMPMVGNTGAYYTGMYDVSLYSYDFRTSAKKKLTDYQARWNVWGDSGWWQANYSCLSSVGNYFTATSPQQIYLINAVTGDKKTIYTLNDSEKSKGYIYGAIVEDGFLNYQLYTRYDSGKKGEGRIDLSGYDSKGTGVTLDKYELVLGINESAKINAEVIPAETENKEVVFSSMDETVARVDSTGMVTGISECDTMIEVKAAAGGKSAYCRVIVRQNKTRPVYTVTFVKNGQPVYSEQVLQGDTVTKVPQDNDVSGWLTDNNALWNPAVPVSKSVTLTARPMAAAAPGNTSSPMDTVLFPAEGETLYLVKGQTYDLNRNYSWTSSDPATAQIVKNKKIKCKGVTSGTVISGKSVAGDGPDITCTVVIAAPTLTKSATVLVGESVKLDLNTVDNSGHYNAVWSSSSPDTASVTDGVVYGRHKGKCKITAWVNGKALSSTIKVVDKKSITDIENDSLTIEPLQTVTLKFADGFKVKKARWSSSLPLTAVKDSSKKVVAYQNSVVRIDTTGKVKAVGPGIVKITAVTSSGEKTIKINVPSPTPRAYYVSAGKSRKFSITGIKPQKMKWFSSAESVAKIKQGKIKAGATAGFASISGNYNPYKNEKGFDYVLNVYTEKPALELVGEGTLTVANNAGTIYTLNIRKGSVSRVRGASESGSPLIYEPVLFKSNNKYNAFVDETGTVFARNTGKNGAPGKAKITAKIAGVTYTINVNVTE